MIESFSEICHNQVHNLNLVYTVWKYAIFHCFMHMCYAAEAINYLHIYLKQCLQHARTHTHTHTQIQ